MTASASPRSCPICASGDRRTRFRQQFATVDTATPVSGYDVVVCNACGFAYADGIPAQEAFDIYYKGMSKYEYGQRDGAESAYDARRLELIADIVAPRLPSTAVRILDVGAASGRLLASLRDRGFTDVLGLDPSPACAAAAARLYSIEVRSLTLKELATTGERFDVIVMVGVLEHLRDLDGAFDAIRAVSATNSLLYVEVPDVTSFADWDNAPYQDFSTEHINFFSPVSLRNLMLKHGFNDVFVEQNHREQSYRTVMSNISGMYRRSAEKSRAFVYDDDSVRGLERYLARSAAEDARLRARIDAIVETGRPMLVWGVGTHTTRLMATSRLREAHIVAFVESNKRYQGRTLNGMPIVGPGSVRHYTEPILISSRVFQKEIADQIRDDLGCRNDLILLYNV